MQAIINASHYMPTAEQRRELQQKSQELRDRLAFMREQRKVAEQFGNMGWGDTAAAELAEIHMEQRA